MGDKKKKRTKKNVLSHDPFADMEDMEWAEETTLPQPGQDEDANTTPESAPPVATAETVAEAAAGMITEAKIEAEAEVESETEESRVLDELIAAIDEEVEAVYGAGPMVDLAAARPVEAGDKEQHVIFSLAGAEYTVPIANVVEIGRPLAVTPVPNVPDWVLGAANLRGDIISMVDLRAFLGLEQVSPDRASRMLVAQTRQEDISVGLIVDQVSGISYLPAAQISAPAAPIQDQVAPYLRGVYEHEGRLLAVLNLEQLLLSPEMQQFESL